MGRYSMRQRIIKLGNDVDLIIDEPASVSSTERTLVVASAIVQEFSGKGTLAPTNKEGNLPIRIGSTVYQVYYQLRVKRVLNALAVYSEAIRHIEENPNLYNPRLACKAIKVLREYHQAELR